MQNPSHGVAQPLQSHVHLISAHRFPLIASLQLEQAFRYLLDAPTIVKSIAPMSWQYVQAPRDGTLWLEWLPPEKMGADGRYPSDGYTWADQESTYRHDYGGYTIEMMTHTVGFRLGIDPMASHARTRYHFVAKNPSVNAAPPDPSLWIVHFHQAEHGRILPSNQVPFTPQMQQMINERRWLEGQGSLEKKDFMLHDRGSWPMIQVPSYLNNARAMQQPGFYGANTPQNRYQYYPQGPPGPQGQPQPKRQRPNQSISGPSAEVLDTTIEDEENSAHGDFFDHLTPRDISMTRYMQHHRWMEEVFSSPYASGHIVPTDLGLGLMGELRGLTDGILEPPSLDFSVEDKPQKPKEAEPFSNLKKEKIEEFNKRVAKHLEEGQAEIERMKAEHATKMAEWKKTKTLMQAERKLRYATWEGHEAALPAYRLEDSAVLAARAEGAAGSKETVEGVVKEVEDALGVKISSHKDANLVEKGGLEEPEQQARTQATQGQHKNVPAQQQEQHVPNGANDGAAETYRSAASEAKPGAPPHVAPDGQLAQQEQGQTGQGPTQTIPEQSASAHPGLDMNDTSMIEGMDVDVDNTDFNFEDGQLGANGDDSTGIGSLPPVQAAAPPTSNASAAPSTSAHEAPSAASTTGFGGPTGPQQPSAPQQSHPPTATHEGTLAGDSIGEGGLDNSMFTDDNTFGDLTNMGNDMGADDSGLIDFGDDGLGIEGSAFDDAIQGMDASDGP